MKRETKQLWKELLKNVVEGPDERYQFTWSDKRDAKQGNLFSGEQKRLDVSLEKVHNFVVHKVVNFSILLAYLFEDKSVLETIYALVRGAST